MGLGEKIRLGLEKGEPLDWMILLGEKIAIELDQSGSIQETEKGEKRCHWGSWLDSCCFFL